MVTIITPTYNHSSYIVDCVNSVRAQEFQDWEQIIVDDGSTDETWERILELAAEEPRIRPFRVPHMGIWRLDSVYNYALDRARGDLVAILEGDDLWPINKLTIQLPYHQGNPIFSYGLVNAVGRGRSESVGRPAVEGSVASTDFLHEIALGRETVHSSSLIIDREALNSIGGFKQLGYFAVDLPTLLELGKLKGEIIFVDRMLGFWRQHEGQTTQAFDSSTDDMGNVSHRLQTLERGWKLREQIIEERPSLGIRLSDIRKARDRSISAWCLVVLDNYFADHVNPSPSISLLARTMMRRGNVLRKAEGVWALLCNKSSINYRFPYSLFEKTGSLARRVFQ